MGLSAELPKEGSRPVIMVGGLSDIVRSMSTWFPGFVPAAEANAAIKSILVVADGRADFGASETGDGTRPFGNSATSSAEMRMADEERSRLSGRAFRLRDDNEMAD